jgi:transaldolase/glucose-6-phosphate isomerase
MGKMTKPAPSPLTKLQELGQSPWHDNIRRELLVTGKLARMIADGDVTGLTSNPTIFEQAIAQGSEYDELVAELAAKRKSAEQIFDALAIRDIRDAADLFAPVYKRTSGKDGFVSIEVAPRFAHDTDATVREARRLWRAVNRPNLMVKIPATRAGIPAIEQSIAEGLNINITLIFSLARYDDVMEAYIRGLDRRLTAGKRVDRIASVASFFVSRVDSAVDKLLDEQIKAGAGEAAPLLESLRGKAAIANAKLAYAAFKKKFGGERFAALARSGARVQRPLWASTSTKNPEYPDVYYVEALIGPDTVDTMPPQTIVAYKDHGKPEPRLERDLDEAERVLDRLAQVGISMDAVTEKLEVDGVASFAASFESLIATVAARREAVLVNERTTQSLGPAARRMDATLAEMDKANVGPRLWKKDTTLWKADDPAHQTKIAKRLGWLDVVDVMQERLGEIGRFVDEAKRAGFTRAVVCGMGGSSLAPEVFRRTFGVARGFLDVSVLDSTDPAAVAAEAEKCPPGKTLFLIASKSGSTTEPNAFFRFFWDREKTGDRFVAITDPGTEMERRARTHNFRHVFLNPPEIGGRYSALSFFGLVPAALLGIDLPRLLERARRMILACGPAVPARHNPGLVLGALLGGLGRAGRDKVTFIASDRIASFPSWVEQLIAESTGKEGVGLVPVEGEPLGGPAVYGKDRLFVYLRLGPRYDRAVRSLARAGHPVVTINLIDAYDLGGEYFRWELATAAAGWVLGIDPFDQPDVQLAKDHTERLLAEHRESGHLPPSEGAVSPAADDFTARLLGHLRKSRAGDYVALTAYFGRTPRREALFRDLRVAIRARFRLATTLGFGPRFLHSTGQLHKGGPPSGVFVQFLATPPSDLPVPGTDYTFGTLIAAQALGDYAALVARERRVLRVDLGLDGEGGLEAALAAIKRGATKTRVRTAMLHRKAM